MEDVQRCPCCKTCEECPYFQNVVNVKSAGLLIYRYSCVQDENIYTRKNERSTEIFILHNTKNNDIASDKLIPKLDQYKKCPRCKYILEHAEKILLNIPTINKLDVLGICDKCRTKDDKSISSCECSEVIDKFIAIKKLNKKEATKRQSKLQKLLNRFISKNEESKRVVYARTRSESNLDNIISHVNSKQKCEPRVNQLFVDEKELRGTNLAEIGQGSISISKTAQKIRFTPKHYSDTELDANNARFGSSIKFKKPLYSNEKINLTEYNATHFQSFLKTSKEYPPKRISISAESLFFNFQDFIEKSNHQPKRESDSLRPATHVQREPRLDKDREPSILDLIAAQNRYRKENIKKDIHEYDTTRTSIISDVGTGILKTKMKAMTSPDTIPKYNSDENFSFSLLSKTKELLQKDFSYFFIKEAEIKKKLIQKHKSSLELIKDTQDMLLAREENLKRKYEEELLIKKERKLDEDDKKRKAREEKILLKENKTVLEKDIGKIEREKNGPDKLDVISKKTSSIEKISKDVRTTLKKSGKNGIKAESKRDEIAEAKSKKAQNEKGKQEKESNLRLEKGQKLREKENLKREKENLKREKENLKRKKEDQFKKETIEKNKKKSTPGKEKTEPSEIVDKEKPVKDKDTRENLKEKKKPSEKLDKDKDIHENLKEKQSEKKSETVEQEKDEIDKSEKQKLIKEKEQKSEKEMDIDENLKNAIEKRRDEEKEMKSEKVLADKKKAKEEATLKLKALREIENKIENVEEQPKPVQKTEEPRIKEININQVKIRRPSHDDLILQLVKLKQSEAGKKRDRPRNISEIHIPLNLITDHKKDHKGIKHSTCAICNDSELELDIEEIILNKSDKIEINNIIIGQKIFKFKQPLKEKSDEKQTFPIFMSIFNDDFNNVPEIDDIPEQSERKPPPVSGKYVSTPICLCLLGHQ